MPEIAIPGRPLESMGRRLSAENPRSMSKTAINLKPSEQSDPYMRIRKRAWERMNKPDLSSTPKRQKGTRGTTSKQYCICLKTNPKGLMVQCNSCRYWVHPGCVGINEAYAKSVPQYICPENSPGNASGN